MKTSASGRALIAACEGLRLSAYKDSVGVLTIGYGHTSAAGPPLVKVGMRLSGKSEADAILAVDLEKVEQQVSSRVSVPLDQHQFDALVSFTFNLGPGNLSRSTLLRKLNAGEYRSASNEFKRWNKAGGKVLRGLTTRREAERLMFIGDVEGALARVGAHTVIPDVEPTPQKEPRAAKQAGGGVVGAIAAGAVAGGAGMPWWGIVLIVLAAAAAGAAIVHFISKRG